MPAKRRKSERQPQYASPTYRALLARIARSVRAHRLARGWSQEEAADRCGMSTRLFQQVEAGASNLTMTTVARLLDGLEIEASELLGDSTLDEPGDRSP